LPTNGVLPLDTSTTYKLRYYATNSNGTTFSNDVTLDVVGHTTSLTLSATPETEQTKGNNVTLTATLTGYFSNAGVNGHTITFKNGSTTLGTANLNDSGIATYTWTPNTAGAYSLTAEYAATAYNKAATSNPISYTVNDTVNVTFDANGGEGIMNDQTVVKGSATALNTNTFTRTGYTFACWNTADNGTGTNYADVANVTLSADTTFYAQWTANSYSITYKDMGDVAFTGTHGESHSTTHTYDTATTLVAPTKNGYTFNGWFDNSTCTGDAITEVGATAYTSDFTLYAKWVEIEKEPEKQKPTTEKWKNPFTDVKETDWFYDVVKNANILQLMNGTSEDIFSPNENVTRGMFITVLYRMENEPAITTNTSFIDLADGMYYNDAISWGFENGIVKGVSEKEYAPDNTITREQMAAMIYRYANFKEQGPTGAWAIRLPYKDLADVSDYAGEAVMWCYMKDIMKGDTNDNFLPLNNASRAEACAVFVRMLDLIK
jgi:uncharacterized repeat protein (TIGR02543 family)